ncbi:MAG TPA: AAA family ATPase [Candidatus Acidoferrales bacterium]|nr:AAA family ATPase [Candidatus Acidoferrales bacterium]
MAAALGFPVSLAEKYRPQTLVDFIGLEKQKKILGKLAANPRPCALLFQGAPGTGKTSMAYAFAAEMRAEVHHVGSQECKVERLQELVRICQYVPLCGGFHVVIIDEADVMSDASQKYLLSKLDSSEPVPNTIWIFTCNAVDRLEERFLSRCIKLPDFNSYGAGEAIADLLANVWRVEAGTADGPNFRKLACGNVRESLMRLETELLMA